MADKENQKEHPEKEGKKKPSKEERIAARQQPKVCLLFFIILFPSRIHFYFR
jgi:hypothetical protein